MELFDYQKDAIKKLRTGSILCGGVGSGKSLTALGYYMERYAGKKDIVIITTALKRDTHEWELDMSHYLLSPDKDICKYDIEIIIDSWNNIEKYVDKSRCFFIFDEQRVVGKGKWVRSFLKITKYNDWILLSATPGDTWQDYIPVFIANGFYRNRSEFIREHVVYNRYITKFPKVEGYRNTGRLLRLRDRILVDLEMKRFTVRHIEDINCDYNKLLYKKLRKDRYDIYKDEPMQSASSLCYCLRRCVNEDISRQMALLEIVEHAGKVIVFYNFDYELDILLDLVYTTDGGKICEVAQWNGHAHQEIPEGPNWVYLVQYNAGAEGWNCIKTDTMVFFSQSYSYKVMEQAMGRIDRLNTPYRDLYYYIFKSRSDIDLAIAKAISDKKKFNESRFAQRYFA